ncbi:TolC family protein [Bacteroides salyersiae]|uniref:TolC family protein n=1 Tax=Bacteroides salyersiae TaxID=291644 RepID=UPI001C3816E3|nr:TolC family protein [Bacteroides salyersiae]MBV4205602.1 TolC family protein [Bacteroides salyersiae]MCB6650776.1 TolC family protein [Bacteroides salyersiae]
MKRLIIILLLSSVYGFLHAQETTALQLSLKDAEKIFLERNLSLIAERYNIDMAQAQVTQARLFENPVISLEQNVYNRLNGKYFDMGKEGEATAEIEQVINLAGQRNKRVRLERVNKEIAEYQFEEVLRTLRSELNRTFVEICFSTRSIGIYDKEIESLGLLMQATKEQQSKGNISLLESSRLESLLLSLRKEKNELENNLVGLYGELNLLLSLPTSQEVTLLLDDEILKQVDAATVSFTDMSRMLSVRPDLKMAHANVTAAQANLKLQRSLAAPEFSIKGMYDRAGNFIDNYFAIGASISVPIFNRNQGNIKSAKLDIQQNGKEEEYAIEKARMELHAAYIRLQKAVELYRSSNDELEHNFGRLIEGVNENFRKRNISMLEFIDYYQSYKETCLQLHELKKEVFLAMENLNTIVGQTVFNY